MVISVETFFYKTAFNFISKQDEQQQNFVYILYNACMYTYVIYY